MESAAAVVPGMIVFLGLWLVLPNGATRTIAVMALVVVGCLSRAVFIERVPEARPVPMPPGQVAPFVLDNAPQRPPAVPPEE